MKNVKKVIAFIVMFSLLSGNLVFAWEKEIRDIIIYWNNYVVMYKTEDYKNDIDVNWQNFVCDKCSFDINWNPINVILEKNENRYINGNLPKLKQWSILQNINLLENWGVFIFSKIKQKDDYIYTINIDWEDIFSWWKEELSNIIEDKYVDWKWQTYIKYNWKKIMMYEYDLYLENINNWENIYNFSCEDNNIVIYWNWKKINFSLPKDRKQINFWNNKLLINNKYYTLDKKWEVIIDWCNLNNEYFKIKFNYENENKVIQEADLEIKKTETIQIDKTKNTNQEQQANSLQTRTKENSSNQEKSVWEQKTKQITIKSKNLLAKDLIISKKELESSKYSNYKKQIDTLVPKLNDTQLISVYKKLEAITNLEKRDLKYFIIYFKAKIGIEIYNREGIEKTSD
jgi:hypothetical protein